MSRFNNPVHVGLRDRVTMDLVAVYPETVVGSDEEVYKKAESWFNQQGYSLESKNRNYFVDTLTDSEFESTKK